MNAGVADFHALYVEVQRFAGAAALWLFFGGFGWRVGLFLLRLLFAFRHDAGPVTGTVLINGQVGVQPAQQESVHPGRHGYQGPETDLRHQLVKLDQAFVFQGGLNVVQFQAQWDERPANIPGQNQVKVGFILDHFLDLWLIGVWVNNGDRDSDRGNGKNEQANDGKSHIANSFHDFGVLPLIRVR